MTIKEFNLLEIDVYSGDELIYSGMSENVPEELKSRQIKIDGNEGKKLIIKLI
jgi:hypothetical protein